MSQKELLSSMHKISAITVFLGGFFVVLLGIWLLIDAIFIGLSRISPLATGILGVIFLFLGGLGLWYSVWIFKTQKKKLS